MNLATKVRENCDRSLDGGGAKTYYYNFVRSAPCRNCILPGFARLPEPNFCCIRKSPSYESMVPVVYTAVDTSFLILPVCHIKAMFSSSIFVRFADFGL